MVRVLGGDGLELRAGREEGVQQPGLELPAPELGHHRLGLGEGVSGPVDPIRGQRVEHVGHRHDAGPLGDLLAPDAERVPRAVPPLVMAERHVGRLRDHRRLRARQQAVAVGGVLLDHRVLGRVETARLEQHRVGHTDLADVVQGRGHPQLVDGVVREADRRPEDGSEAAHALEVLCGLLVAQ